MWFLKGKWEYYIIQKSQLAKIPARHILGRRNKGLMMIKILVLVLAILLAGCGSSGDNVTKSSVVVKINDGIIYYKGAISEQNYKVFQKALNDSSDEIFSKLIINSGGGSTVYGRKMGRFIFNTKLDVEVEKLCFSSCANYIFPAGKNKIIQEDAFVGWHGNEYQAFIIGPLENKTASEFIKDETEQAIKNATKDQGLSEETINTSIEQVFKQRVDSLKDEKSFFEYIGVDKFVSLLGLKELFLQKKHGFTYSIEDMERFNITNVTYLGLGVYPKSLPAKMFVYAIKETDKEVMQQVFDIDNL